MRISGLHKVHITAETIQQYLGQFSTLAKHSPFWQGYSKRSRANSIKLANQWGANHSLAPSLSDVVYSALALSPKGKMNLKHVPELHSEDISQVGFPFRNIKFAFSQFHLKIQKAMKSMF